MSWQWACCGIQFATPADYDSHVLTKHQPGRAVIKECGNCHFVFSPRKNIYQCRRNPPQIFVDSDGEGGTSVSTDFPTVLSSEWCGEWKPNDWCSAENGNLKPK